MLLSDKQPEWLPAAFDRPYAPSGLPSPDDFLRVVEGRFYLTYPDAPTPTLLRRARRRLTRYWPLGNRDRLYAGTRLEMGQHVEFIDRGNEDQHRHLKLMLHEGKACFGEIRMTLVRV